MKFLNMWSCCTLKENLIDIALGILHEDSSMWFICRVAICNVDLFALEFDGYKTNIVLFGFGIQVWYNQNEEV